MELAEWKTYIEEAYSAEAEYPWKSYPGYCVFRHTDNRKWFALIADVPKNKLGIAGEEYLNILNLKLDPMLITALRSTEGFYPAYHMNKTTWITIVLDGSVTEEKIKDLLEMSFELTMTKGKKKRVEENQTMERIPLCQQH